MAKSKKRKSDSESINLPGVGRLTKKSCYSSKASAEKAAETIRHPKSGEGHLARVIKKGNAHCVFEGRRRKSK